MTQEDIERLWNSVVHFIPEKQKADAAIDFVKCLDDIGVEHDEIKAIGEYDPKLDLSDYLLPSIDLLTDYGGGSVSVN